MNKKHLRTQDEYDISLSLYETGREAMNKKDYDSAIKKFKESLKIQYHFKTAQLLGECLLLKEEYREAIIYLACAIGLGRNEFRARYLIAQAILQVEEKPFQVMRYLKEAIKMKPDYKSAKELYNELAEKWKGHEDHFE